MPRWWIAFAAVLLIGWAVLADLGLPVRLPYRRQQVPEDFRSLLPAEVIAVTFGFMLGVGFLTLFTYSAQLTFFVAAPFLDQKTMIASAALFAAGKSIVLLTVADGPQLGDIGPRFHTTRARLRVLRATTATGSIAVAVLLVMSNF